MSLAGFAEWQLEAFMCLAIAGEDGRRQGTLSHDLWLEANKLHAAVEAQLDALRTPQGPSNGSSHETLGSRLLQDFINRYLCL